MSRRYPFASFVLVLLLPLTTLHAADREQLTVGDTVEEGTGTEWVVDAGATLHLRVVENQWQLYELDAERKVVEPSLDRAIMRGNQTLKRSEEVHLTLRALGEPCLSHARRVFPPFDYWLILIVPDATDGEDGVRALPRKRFQQ